MLFFSIRNAETLKLLALIVTILGGLILIITYKDNFLVKVLKSSIFKAAYIGFYMIIVGWIVAIFGWITKR
ncbi:MAG: hypothetical protein GX220_06140 [Treponema sp.]|nr:hypothetical protein [Treponema sp.]